MPIYEYQCASCGHQLEALQKVTDEPLTSCPSCHKNALGKLVSAPSFQLKGTGWYETDFKTKNKKESPTDSKNESPSETSTTTDVKSETATTSSTETSTKGKQSE